MSKLTFEKNKFVENNPKKKNILITVSQLETREYTYGYVFPLVELLKEEYNVYFFYEGGLKAIDNLGMTNVYRMNKAVYHKFKEDNLKRKKELETSDVYNQDKIDSAIREFFADEPVFDNIMIIDNHNLMLPFNPLSNHPKLRELFNDYFDTFEDDDPEVMAEIKKLNHKLFDVTAKSFSPLAFRYMYKNVMLSVVEQVAKMNDAKVHIMLIDPSAAIPFFKHKGLDHKFWYYSDDHRHTRDFFASPFTELQHLVYEPIWKGIKPEKKNLLDDFFSSEKKIPFFFAGSLLNDKGLRKYIWQDFFKDFDYAGSQLYFKVSLIYGMDKDAFEKMGAEVSAHPNFCGDFMPNSEYMNVLKKCKTAFIARNVSANGGLTYRHIQYLYFDVLPIFDYLYDQDYLWIPKEFQDKLTVKSAEELRQVVEYYDKNDKERKELLEAMKKHYDVEGWLTDWKKKAKETNLIKELLYENRKSVCDQPTTQVGSQVGMHS
jgi:hypothetical protein